MPEITWVEAYCHLYTNAIDENYYLLIGGGNMQMFPLYIYLVSKADDSVSIDIRTENVEEFIDGLD